MDLKAEIKQQIISKEQSRDSLQTEIDKLKIALEVIEQVYIAPIITPLAIKVVDADRELPKRNKGNSFIIDAKIITILRDMFPQQAVKGVVIKDEVLSHVPCSSSAVYHHLMQLVRSGYIEKVGAGKWKYIQV